MWFGIALSVVVAGLVFMLELREFSAARRVRLNLQLENGEQRLLLAAAELDAAAAFLTQANPAVPSFQDFIGRLPVSRATAAPWTWAKIVRPGDVPALEAEIRAETVNPGFAIDRTGPGPWLAPVVAATGAEADFNAGEDLARIPALARMLSEPVHGDPAHPDDAVLPHPEGMGRRLLMARLLPVPAQAGERAAHPGLLLRGMSLAALAETAGLGEGQRLLLRDVSGGQPMVLLAGGGAADDVHALAERAVTLGSHRLMMEIAEAGALPFPRTWAVVLLLGLLTTAAVVALKAGQLIRKEANSLSSVLTGARQELSEARRKEVAFFENSGTANCETDYATGQFIRVNGVFCEMLGYGREDLIGKSFTDITHPGDLEKSRAALQDQDGSPNPQLQFEKRYLRKDGSAMWAVVNARLNFGGDGEPQSYSTVILDITARKADEEIKSTLLRELAHRVRNTVQLTVSLARQTARSARSVRDYDSKFQRRMTALSVAQDLLFDAGWKDAPLRDIAMRTIRPFLPDGGREPTLAVDLPDIRLSTQQAQTLAIAIHELASNSAEHGALAHGGAITFTGRLEDGASPGRRLVLHWEETSTKRIRPPRKTGFGTDMLNSALPGQFGGSAKLTWRSKGLLYEAELPLPPA